MTVTVALIKIRNCLIIVKNIKPVNNSPVDKYLSDDELFSLSEETKQDITDNIYSAQISAIKADKIYSAQRSALQADKVCNKAKKAYCSYRVSYLQNKETLEMQI